MVIGNYHSAVCSTALEVKIILLGDYSVGKSSLLRLLARHGSQMSEGTEETFQSMTRSSGSFRTQDRPSSSSSSSREAKWMTSSSQPGSFAEIEFTHHDRNVLARISDTGGQERYRSMTTSYYRGAHGCLLMFDVTKEETFTNLETWVDNIKNYTNNDDFPCILVGNRCKSPARRVSYERAAQYADARGLAYMELDMEHMTEVRRVFESLLDSVSVNLSRRTALAITIRPEISNKDFCLRKNFICSC